MAGKYLEVAFDPQLFRDPGRFGPLQAIADVGRDGLVSDMILALAKRPDVVGVSVVDENGEYTPAVGVGDFGRFVSTVTIPPGVAVGAPTLHEFKVDL